MQRAALVVLLLLSLITPGVILAVQPVELAIADDLATDAVSSRRGEMPILLLVSQDHCPFCHQIKREILHPMRLAGDYEGQLLMREIFIDFGSTVVDFKGKRRDSSEFTLGYGVYLTPTLLFLGPDGEELAERIVGIQTPEMFFFYVDKAIQQAIQTLRGKS